MNMATDAESFEQSIRIPFRKEEFNPVRSEYSQMLRQQLARGNNGLTKTKFLDFWIEADSMKQAKPRLDHVETDLLTISASGCFCQGTGWKGTAAPDAFHVPHGRR